MHVHINHMFCTDPCWGKSDTMYWCKYLVAVERIGKDKTYHDTPEEDWTNLTVKVNYFDEEEYKRLLTFSSTKGMSDEDIRRWATKKIHIFNPEVIQWLNENVKDRRGEPEYPQGWCIGSEDYHARESLSISIFFHRRSDAMAFIKEWSVYKKPTTYFDYFRGIYKELNLETGKLVKVDRG